MSISWRSAFGSFWVAVAIMGGCVCLAASSNAEQASRGDNEVRFSLSAGIRSAREHASSLHLLTGYNADPGECGDVMLGPLPDGEYTGEEAWLKLIESVCTLDRRDSDSGGIKVFADISKCKCSFGLPRLAQLQQPPMLVTGSSLSELSEYIASNVKVINRKRIRETGAASIPDLLRYFSQTAFHRGRGYRASGAQYAELRGLGAAYTLVLLNGRRAYGTATDLATSAFDLSSIPISAVERVEISTDANSLVHGMDAIGGIVNVVLSDSVEPEVKVRYGWASGGASQTHASMSGGARGKRGWLAVHFDVDRRGELLGRKRDRWNNQDFTRFGGQDYRSQFASPGNVSSTNGQDLPGLGAPFAAAELNPETGMFDFVAGRRNRTSLRAFQAIVPQALQGTIWANGAHSIGPSVASLELLAVNRENELQLIPSVVPGYTWGANHPENSFDVPVRLEALLEGLPAQRMHYGTHSLRGVAAIEGPLRDWGYSVFVVRSDEETKAHMRNATDPFAIARALQAEPEGEALSVYSTVRRTAVPAGIFVDSPVERYHASATHLQASVQGSLQPLGGSSARLGVEHRHETMDFNGRISGADRDITSTFAHLRFPVRLWAVDGLDLLFGVRRDDYSDVGAITKKQFGLRWCMTPSIQLRASTSESFRPPSLVELYFPRIPVQTQIFDPKREQAGPVELMTGGNPELIPTTGRSNSVGVSFRAGDGLRLSADYWRVTVRNHVSLLAPMSLLANEDFALEGRIERARPENEAPGQPGRLLRLDISRANVGGAAIQGVDLAAEKEFETSIGSIAGRLSVTLTDKFEYSDLPITRLQMEDRAGVASEFGTIPAQRGVASVTYEGNDLRVSVHARVISPYRDRSEITGEPMQQEVPGGALWDLNISKKIVGNLHVTVGAFNVTNREPPFAHAGGSLGFDTSQGDLGGREIYVTLSGSF